MPQPNQIIVKDSPGLMVQPSKLGLPPGAVIEAQEADCLREGVYEIRRGFNFYGPTVSAADFLQYRLRLLLRSGSTLSYDSDGAGTAWTPYAGTIDPPDATTRIHFVEAAQNLYFTTALGVQVIDALAGTPRLAGMPQGLDLNPARTGTGAGFQTPNTKVGYKVVFLRKDANGNEIAGSASYRDDIANPAAHAVVFAFGAGVVTVTDNLHGYLNGDVVEISDVSDPGFEAGPHVITWVDANTCSFTVAGAPPGAGTGKASKKFNVALSITLPGEIQAGNFWELYRTEMSASEDTDPGDRYLLVKRVEVVAGDVAAGYVAYTDSLDQSLLGVQLESNQTANGTSQTPDRPPWAKYIAAWKDHVWYAHTKQAHSLKVQLLDVAGLVDDTSSITITSSAGSRTFTFSAAENLGARKFKRWTSATTLAENLRLTMRSFTKIVNRDAGPVVAHYVSGTRDAPGIVLLRHRQFNVPAFSLTVDGAGTGAKFTPVLPAAGTSVSSDDDYRRNGVYNARSGRPEAVPMANAWRAGSDLDEVRGILATSGALLVFTSGGIYQITGVSDGGPGKLFNMDELDLSLILEAPETLAKLDDHAYGWFNQGVCRVSGSSSAIVSEGKIENRLKVVSKYSNAKTASFACAYETDHKYVLFTPAGNADTYPKNEWVYNYLRNNWSGPWLREARAAIVLKGKDLLYLARADQPWVVQERKSYNLSGEDQKDETYACTPTLVETVTPPEPDTGTVTRVTVTYTGADNLEAGWLFRQDHSQSEVILAEPLGGTSYRLTLADLVPAVTVAAGAAEISRPIDMRLCYALDGGNAAALKQSTDCQVYFDHPHPRRVLLGYQSDMQRSVDWLPTCLIPRAAGGWGFGWGYDWGSENKGYSDPLRMKVHRDHQRNRILHVFIRHKSAGSICSLLQTAVDTRVISSVTKR